MKVIIENAIMFKDLSIGDVFRYRDRMYLKTEEHYSNDEEKEINAVDLESGLFVIFNDHMNVYPVVVTMTVTV